MFMNESRSILERFAPGLDAELARQGLTAMESKDPLALKALIRQYRLPRLWVPTAFGGEGISPYDGIRIQRALGARAPSMALMLTMHNFTVSFCSPLSRFVPSCAQMLRDVAMDGLLVASAFAEGRRGAGILDSTVYLTPDGEGFRLNGQKKPCTMANSMDIITVGVALQGADSVKHTGMAILPARQKGVSRREFWRIPLLAAADNHELCFENVHVTSDQLLLAAEDDRETAELVASAEVEGMGWFEIVATASYLGVVSAMAERVLRDERVDLGERAALGGEIECAQATLDGAVHMMETSPNDQGLLARVLMVRFAVQRVIARCAMQAAELAGGLAFIENAEMMTLLAGSRCLAFHPMSRKAAEPMLADWLKG